MSIVAMKWAIGMRGMGSREKSVLLVLAWHANSKTQRCNPSTRTIAAEACMSRNTVDLALDELHRLGLVDSQVPRRRDVSTRYSLNLDAEFIEPDRGSTARPRRGSTDEPRRGSVSIAGVAQPLGQKGKKEPHPEHPVKLRIAGGRDA